ncbi:MAG: methionyl-tRNA formyltransferase [Steroidobacteraceae bacterium]
MRFAITLTDRYLPVLEALLAAGWQPVKLFTSPVDDRIFHNKLSLQRAQQLDIPVQISRMLDADLLDLSARGCDALVVASYRWRIGEWQPHLRYAVNFHPSPLPIGRGAYPVVRAILDGHTQWGISCHKLAPRFDSGDILAQETFPIAADECHETLDLKTQLASGVLARKVAGNFETLWREATVQGEGSYWKLFTDADRTLDFRQPVERIIRTVRAFGDCECLAKVAEAQIYVRRAVAWPAEHTLVPGTVVHNSAMRLVVAASDGYVGLLEWSLIAPDALAQRIGR